MEVVWNWRSHSKKIAKNLTQTDQPRLLCHKSRDSEEMTWTCGASHAIAIPVGLPWSLAVIPGNTVSIKEIRYFVYFNAFISVGQSSQRSQTPPPPKKKIEKLFERCVSCRPANFNRRHIGRTQIVTRPPN